MRFLKKKTISEILTKNWKYSSTNPPRNKKIKEILLTEQSGFCAYSEVYIRPIDSCDVEHFDERLKNTSEDNYYNWYAVSHFFNSKKTNRKIKNFIPMLSPSFENISQKIKYEDSLFQPKEENDSETKNLIGFIGMNVPELVEYRNKFIAQKVRDRDDLNLSQDEFIFWLESNPENLSFISALESELGLSLRIPD